MTILNADAFCVLCVVAFECVVVPVTGVSIVDAEGPCHNWRGGSHRHCFGGFVGFGECLSFGGGHCSDRFGVLGRGLESGLGWRWVDR